MREPLSEEDSTMCKTMWSLIVLFVLVMTSALGAAIPASADTPTPIETAVRPADGMVMVYVPAGPFLMGSPKGEGIYTEQPQHEVNLDAFWIDQT